MKFTKTRPQTEIQIIKDLCKEAGFNFAETTHAGEYDAMGNILYIETTDKKLQKILKAQGFTN